MKLLLVDNLVMPEEGSLAYLDVHPHLGLLALAAVAEADGHRVRIYDPKRLIRDGTLAYDATLYERASRAILAERPDVVGFTALGCSFLFALNVAALLKRREPDLPVLLGGPHATMLHRQILERFPQFDIIVRYEADEILPAVLDCLEQRTFDVIPGVSWRATGRGAPLRFTDGKPKVEELDRLPIASYDHYPVDDLGLSSCASRPAAAVRSHARSVRRRASFSAAFASSPPSAWCTSWTSFIGAIACPTSSSTMTCLP